MNVDESVSESSGVEDGHSSRGDSGSDASDVVHSPEDESSLTTRQVKVDGEIVEVPWEDLEAAYGLEKASRKRFEEASALRKEVDTFIDKMQDGDLEGLMDLVPEDKLEEFAESLLRKRVEWEETPEETRARITAERERDALQEKLDEYTQKEQEQIQSYVSEISAEEIDNDIADVVEELGKTHGDLVKSPEFIQDIARVMLAQLENGAAGMSAKKAANLAYKTWESRIGSYVKNVSHADLPKYLSKKQMAEIRRAKIDNAFDGMSQGEEGQIRTRKKKSNGDSVEDFFANLDKQFG